MPVALTEEIEVGPYRGCVDEDFRDPSFLAQLAELPRLLEGPDCRIIAGGHTRLVLVRLAHRGHPLDVVVKVAGRRNALHDFSDRRTGSRSRRTMVAAQVLHRRGVGTPRPIAFLDRWQGRRLAESYYLSEFVERTSLRDELIRLYRHDPDCGRIMLLLQRVADAVRSLHEAGVIHHDLGNQNILLRRNGGDDWTDLQFIDLNRARVRGHLSLRDRARDISRLTLPSDFLRVFKEMYFNAPPPRAFNRWESLYRTAYTWHTRSRRFRHPLRESRNRAARDPLNDYPPGRDLWIWDERSVQAVSALNSRDRGRLYPKSNALRMLGSTLRALPRVCIEYRRLKRACFRGRVEMRNRIGVALSTRPDRFEREFALLRELGPIPVLVRFYRHESEDAWQYASECVRRLRAEGHAVAAALVQDRTAVRQPETWEAFCRFVLERVAAHVDWVEVGHAINRVKWGVWSLREHRGLLEVVAEFRGKYPELAFMGPAAIDFEYPFVIAALDGAPAGLRFGALSHHLYVDRRGAPENRQGMFDALDKMVLARAIARRSTRCEDRLIVSEVNWPIKGTGVYSPVGSPYESPGVRFNDPSVSEHDYGIYMVRYLALALCSGMVERVYWWRLVARGFGLVDDAGAAEWRKRPAFDMLRVFVRLAGMATFVERLPAAAGVYALAFESPSSGRFVLAWSCVGPAAVSLPFDCNAAIQADGTTAPAAGRELDVSGAPVYFCDRIAQA